MSKLCNRLQRAVQQPPGWLVLLLFATAYMPLSAGASAQNIYKREEAGLDSVAQTFLSYYTPALKQVERIWANDQLAAMDRLVQLMQRTKQYADTAQGPNLFNYPTVFGSNKDFLQTLQQLQKHLQNPDSSSQGQAVEFHYVMGQLFRLVYRYESAFAHYSRMLDQLEKMQKWERATVAACNQARFARSHDYKPALLDLLDRAKRLAEHPQVSLVARTYVYQTLGESHYYYSNYVLALENYRKALELSRELPQPHPKTLVNRSNIALVKLDEGQVEESLDMMRDIVAKHNRVLQNPPPGWDTLQLLQDHITYTINLARAQVQAKQFDQALATYNQALALSQGRLQGFVRIQLFNNMAWGMLEMGQTQRAKAVLDSIQKYIQGSDYHHIRFEFYKNLMYYYRSIQDYRNLAIAQDSFLRVQNYQLIRRINRDYNQMFVRFETQNKTRELDQLEAQMATQQKLQLALGGIGVLAFLFAGVQWRNSQRMKRLNRQISEQEEAKSLLLRELHHRVKNNMQVLSSLFNTQMRFLEQGDARSLLEVNRNRFQAIALLHKELYADETTEVKLDQYLRELIHNLVQLFGYNPTDPDSIQLDLDLCPASIRVEYGIPLGLVCNEILTNSLKYAFQPGERPHLVLKSRYLGDKLEIEVGDLGRGMTEQADKHTRASFGSKLVSLMVDQLKGGYRRVQGKGVRYLLTIPYQEGEAEVQRPASDRASYPRAA